MTARSQNPSDWLREGRELFARKAWLDAHEALTKADAEEPLELEDTWRLAWSASLCGRDTASFATLERIYQRCLETQPLVALRAAFWLGFRLVHMNESSRGQGWLARAERCLERAPESCVERGYLQLPRVRAEFSAGRYDEALASAKLAAELGERFNDADLTAFARNLQGRTLLRQGSLEAGFKLLDEAMLSVTGGEVSPVLTGLIYCSAIDSCQSLFALGRMREWTDSLRGWCDEQPQLCLFNGACLIARAEIMEVAGKWPEALAEASRAVKWISDAFGPGALGEAVYREAEILRLQGELDAAEARYRVAAEGGRDPQPGLSLLRLAQGRADVAAQALRRALAACTQPLARAKLLPALVEALLASGVVADARKGADELGEIARTFGTEALRAVAARARGSVELQEGDGAAALLSLREAFELLQPLGAPYLGAQTRVLLACAYRALGDDEGAQLEIAAARGCFQSLGALSDVRAIDALMAQAVAPPGVAGLSPRELEVLRLVASGKTNKLIAGALCLSEKTVDRHVSNILAKLNVPSRAAATAFAYENKLM